MLASQIVRNVYVSAISDTNLDDSFLVNQFEISGFSSLFMKDRDQYGRGIFVRDDDIRTKY